MATTDTYTYTATAGDLIDDALRMLGVLEEGKTASADQLSDALPSFEMYLKSLSKYGLNLWTITNEGESETLVASTGSYTTDNKALKILECVFRDSDGNDTVLIPLTRQEYWNLNDKDQTGQPTQYFFDPNSQANSTIYLWPVPDSNNAGSGETIEIVYQQLLEDITATTNNIDVPVEWLETIKYGLATRLAPMHGYPTRERELLLNEYQQMLQESLEWDTEQESVYLRPEPRYGD